MFSTESRNRQPQSQLKTAINSKKFLNINPIPTVMATKTKNVANGVTYSAQFNNLNHHKSKLMVLRNPKAVASNQTSKNKNGENRSSQSIRTSNIPITSVNKIQPVSRVLLTPHAPFRNRKANLANQMPPKETLKNEPISKIRQTSNASLNTRKANRTKQITQQEAAETQPEQDKKREITEMAIQANEAEILNHSLIVGDFKIVAPSKTLTEEIDKLSRELETKKLLKATRKFEEHSLQDEQHLDDLKEFLDKSYITRKPYKLMENNLEEDRKLIASMDELLKRERPKTESITDIRSRIKFKEQELLNLFDNFQKNAQLFGKT